MEQVPGVAKLKVGRTLWRLLSDSRMHVVALVVVLDSGLLCVPRRRPQKLGSRLARDAPDVPFAVYSPNSETR